MVYIYRGMIDENLKKNYSENKTIATQFVKKKIFVPTERYILIGSYLCPICRVTV